MKNYNYTNGKKNKLKEFDSEVISLSGTTKKKRGNLCIKHLPKIFFGSLFFIFIISFVIFIVIKIKFEYINKNYVQNNRDVNSFIKEAIDIHKIEKMNDINFIKNFKLNNINESDVQMHFDYLDKAKNGIYLNPQNLVKVDNPKVSVIISIYNREDYVMSTVRSIQNQNMKEIEILYIDDYSSDNSTKYIKEEQKKDPRIILYKNKQNMGALYSKSIGVLLAKGEYIYSLDSDDMFCSENYLNSLYELAKKKNYEFLRSKALYINLISKRIKKRKPYWTVLWSKLIETRFYRKAIYSLGYNALNNKVNVLDDDVVFKFMMNGKGKSINKIGVAHFVHPGNHIYFKRFSNKKNRLKYCLNIVNTIKALYAVLRNKGKRYGNFLLTTHFYRGHCAYYRKQESVKALLKYYKSNKKRKIKKDQMQTEVKI